MFIKCIFTILMFISFNLADDLSIQILKDIEFNNGFGQIEAKPLLKDISKDIKMLGEFNVEDKSGNVVLKLDKVLYDGKIYNLSEEFISKRRLKNKQNAKLAKQSKIKLSGGNRAEILSILNNDLINNKETTLTNNYNKTNTNDSINTGATYIVKGTSNGNGGYNNYPPYNYPNTYSATNNTLPRTNLNSKETRLVDNNSNCKSSEIKDGMVYVYPEINGVCTQKAASQSNLYKKVNTSTCPNKIDYDNMLVSIGEEQYINIDNTEYKVKSCVYTNNLALQKTTETCKVIPNFDKKEGVVQKQYWYILNNEKVNVGACTPTKEIIPLYDDDFNSCKYRFDFVNNKAIKQSKWYYNYENKKVELGECVDSAKLNPISLYESTQGCSCKIIDGVNVCQSKLSFNGINNTKEDATQCRYINTEGIKLIDEFVGNYAFKDESKQAIKKINQYFIGVGGEKIYLTKDKETNIAFPYKEESCGWKHDNDKKLSYHKSRIYIKDPELLNIKLNESLRKVVNGDTYEIKSCEANTNIVLYWQEQLELLKGAKLNEYKRQVLIPDNLSSSAKKWSIPLIQTKNKKMAMLEDGQVPIWSSNFNANNFLLHESMREDNKWRVWGINKKIPAKWNYYFNNLSLNDSSNLGNISIGWTIEEYYATEKVCMVHAYNSSNTLVQSEESNEYNKCSRKYNERYYNEYRNAYYVIKYRYEDKQVKKYREVGLNNPLQSDSKIQSVYSITLKNPLTIKPNKIIMDENLTQDKKDNTIEYKVIQKDIIDPNTSKCVLHDGQNTDPNGENYNSLANTCKKENVILYTTGVSFTPNYPVLLDSKNNKYCKANEEQSYESIEENSYIPREKKKDESYYDYINSIKNEALNINNYSKSISKILCKVVDNSKDSSNNAYIIGAIINYYKPNSLTKLEIETLENMSLRLTTTDKFNRKGSFLTLKIQGVRNEYLRANFSTKPNYANNQTIYEYEMYRNFRRPDGSSFKLYEREGYFTTPQTINCPNCNKLQGIED